MGVLGAAKSALEHGAVTVVRSGPATNLARRLTRGRLRIIGVHGVPDPDRFGAQMRYLAERWRPVGEAEVHAAVHQGGRLPVDAVWVTFDDGDPSVVRNGLSVLADLAIPATMFVCPGLIESGEPFWWNVTDRAAANGPTSEADLTERMKTLADAERRAVVAKLRDGGGADPAEWRQLEIAELDEWLSAGMTLGNHTWDHPCLDRCDVAEQRRQVDTAHDWLREYLGRTPLTFAYPNGNFAEPVDRRLRILNYSLGLLYDNRLTSLDEPLRLSRLMLETGDAVERVNGIMSGAQPFLKAAATRLTRVHPNS